MEYYEAANFLFDCRRFQVDPGTESVRELLAHLGDPHADTQFVQVAGSNGKGSVARLTESALRADGRRVGLYTSPHFEDFRERIRVDGRKIPAREVTAFVEEAKPWLVDRAADGEPLTFFEVVTALALWRFGRADADVAVLEVGMGGALDATSVVTPTAACVTNVALEHTAVLGETHAEIAEGFAAVAPPDNPLVTSATGEGLETLRAETEGLVTVGRPDERPDVPDVRTRYEGRRSHQESAVGITAGGTLDTDENTAGDMTAAGTAGDNSGDGDTAGGWQLDARIPLLGSYQANNAGIAATLARQLGVTDERTLKRGLRSGHWPGRFEVMDREPLVVLDGAHNPAACHALRETLAEFEYDDLHLVFAALHDKDHREMARALPSAATVTTCAPSADRAEDPETLGLVFREETTGEESTTEDAATSVRVGSSVAGAFDAARAAAEPGDAVVLTGSLYAVAEARTDYTRTVTPKRFESVTEAREELRAANVPAAGIDRAAGETITRTVETRVASEQATRLREAALAAGVTPATAGFDNGGQLHDVVLSGTLVAFERLVADLHDRGHGLSGVARDLGERLGPAVDSAHRPAETESPAEDVGTDTATAGGPTSDEPAGGGEEPDKFPWSDGTAVMAVLNITPDSFHDGGEYDEREAALARAERAVEAGADILDVGGESTRPGADPVPPQEEIDRIVPVIEAIDDAVDAAISVDTRKASVAEAALDAGADILNDVTGLEDPEMRFLAARRDVPVIVMHSIDAPVVAGKDVEYDDVVRDVIDELGERVLLAEKAGVPRENVVVDPGIGFGKTGKESFELLGRIDEFHALGCPVLVGHSHKSLFEFVGGEAGDALPETIAASAIAAREGADILRVHDVRENAQAVRVAAAAADPDRFADRHTE